MKELMAVLSEQEWDVVGRALIQRPYHEVAGIIKKMNDQFVQQQGDQNAAASDGSGPDQPTG